MTAISRASRLLILIGVCALWPGNSLSAQFFIRGDVDFDGTVSIGDGVDLIGFLYDGQPPVPDPLTAGDVNDNGVREVADVMYLLRYSFVGGSVPPQPFPASGTDPTPPSFPTAPDGLLQYELGNVIGCLGAPVSLPFRISNAQTQEALNINFTFDPTELAYLSASSLPLQSVLGFAPDFFVENIAVGAVQIGLIFDFDDPTANGLPPLIDTTILELAFSMDPSVTVGSTLVVNLEDDTAQDPPHLNLGSVLGQVQLAQLNGGGAISVTCFPSEASLAIDAPVPALPGSSATATVRLTNSTAVEGFSFGLATDPALTPLSVGATGPLAATNGGNGPDFLTVDLAPANGDGLTVACTITATGPSDTIPAGTDVGILSVELDLAADAGPACSILPLSFVGGLGSPAVPLEVTTVGGVTAPPSTFDGGVEVALVDYPTPTGGITLRVEAGSVDPGDDTTVRVLLDSDASVQAVSFGLAYDATDLTVDAIEVGHALEQLACGAGPDYFFGALVPGGLTVTAALDIAPPFEGAALPPASEQPIARLRVSTAANPSTTGTDWVFSGALGAGVIPVALEVTVDGALVVPATIDGTTNFILGPGAFTRGDCNDDGSRNIADAIAVLGYLFPGAGGPVVLPCEDACDGNDDGSLNVADAVAVLNSLFGSPAVPLPPPNACGPDPTADSLICPAVTSCP